MTVAQFGIFFIIGGLIIIALIIISIKTKDNMTFIFMLFLLSAFIFTSVRFKIDNLSAPSKNETKDSEIPTYICGIN